MKKATNERKFPGSVLPFSPGNWNPYARPWHETQSCGSSWCEANFIPINLYLGHQNDIQNGPTAFNALCTSSFSANPTVSFKIIKPKRRLPWPILAAPTFRRNLRASSSAAGVPSTLVPGSLGEMLLSKNPEMPLSDKSCWWYCTFCISFVSGYICNM